jgi:ArsR family transcriptional regulator, arsenate/arsenite/antimonite-responsive transcriptional repressor
MHVDVRKSWAQTEVPAVVEATVASGVATDRVSVAEGCCAPLGSVAFGADDAVGLARAFAALGDPVRLHLLSLIATRPDEGVCVCDLVGPVGRSQPTVSHHLRVLREAGLVTSEKRGTWAWYRPVPDRLAELRAALA